MNQRLYIIGAKVGKIGNGTWSERCDYSARLASGCVVLKVLGLTLLSIRTYDRKS